jgi:large subunit ribosomal protein L30
MSKCLLAIRIRGGVNAHKKIESTLRMLRIDKTNYATLLDDRPSNMGMLQKVKDYVTWGEPSIDIITQLIEKKGQLAGRKKITETTLTNMGYKSFKDVALEIYEGRIDSHKLDPIKPFFRLHPPKKGFKCSIKRPYKSDGELGYRGEAINDLAKRMC